MPNKRTITAEDLYNLKEIKDVRISPDGEKVIFVLQRVDRKTEKKYSNLWIASTRGGRPRRFTQGNHVDTMPRWSPDGKTIAFVSNRDDEKQPQVYLISMEGGEAEKLTDLKGEFGSMEWSPDGRKLLLQFRKKDAEVLEREKDEQKKKLGVVERHVTRLFYKLDGYGYLPKERWHIWTVDARTGKGRQLTDGEVYDEIDPVWSPDGESIFFVSNRQPDPDLHPDVIDLYRIPAGGGEIERIPTPLGPKYAPSPSPDGLWVAYLGNEGEGNWWMNTSLWVVPADGSGEARNLTASHDLHAEADALNDLSGALFTMRPTWSPDGGRIYFQTAEHGKVQLRSIGVDGGDLRTEIDEKGVVGAYTFDRENRRMAYFFGSMESLGEVRVWNVRTGRHRTVARPNRNLLARLNLGSVEEAWFEGKDGYRLQGWILKPPGFDPSQKYPSILEIHGGPQTQYGYFFMHEFYFLAAQGYVVYFSNPRGGRGYGEDHTKAIWGRWGTVDYDDLMAWADFVEKQPYIDPNRMGVTGGSYGGYMTLWIIGHTQRFRAAVAQRVVSNFISMWGSSDGNWIFQLPLEAGPPWVDFQKYWERSPIAHLGNASTPTLLIHSEQDHRCPIEQGEQAFVALKVQGVDTEMVRFPDEPHGLSRTGRTDRRISRLKHILRWFDGHIR
jgi:dipeptidyl aminopeptidase/acylaminoacyl peptidase